MLFSRAIFLCTGLWLLTINLASGQADIVALPSVSQATVDEVFTVEVAVRSENQMVSAANVFLSFDPSVIMAQSITVGGALDLPIIPEEIDNTAGLISYAYGTFGVPPAGDFSLFTVEFRAVGNGTSGLDFVSVNGVPTDLAFEGGSVLSNTISASVSVSTDGNLEVVLDDVTTDRTLSADTCYILDGFVFVESGATLAIEPGTVIKGLPGNDITTGDFGSALIVLPGGTIIADADDTQNRFPNSGNNDGVIQQSERITFTALIDDVTLPSDVGPFESGLWGGVLVLGRAPLNSSRFNPTSENPITDFIDGLPQTSATAFGGDNESDNSGILRGVAIAHAGAPLSPTNEIAGLTLAGVGNGTLADFVEIFACANDGIEWLGGTCDLSHAVVINCGGEAFDVNQGATFEGQFWLALTDDRAGSDRSGEHEGTFEGGQH